MYQDGGPCVQPPAQVSSCTMLTLDRKRWLSIDNLKQWKIQDLVTLQQTRQ
jgi:hypothetical protein